MTNFIKDLANILSCETDTIVTIFITVLIFISGILLNIFISGLKKLNDRRNYRNFIIELINNISIYTKKQANNFEKFQSSLKISNHQSFFLTRHTENSLDTFSKIPIERIYDSFLGGIKCNTKKRRKALRFILNNTQLIGSINSGLPGELDKMITKFNQYENIWNNSIEEIRKIFDFFRQQYFSNSINPAYVPFVEDLNKVFSEWMVSKDSTNRVQVKEKIVDVLPNNIIKKYNSLEIITQLQNTVLDAKLAFENMENLLKIYESIFSGYSKTFENYERKMKVAKNMLN